MKKTITIVGSGNVGATIAYGLLADSNNNFVINFIEIDQALKRGRYLDLVNANVYKNHSLHWNDFDLFSNSDFIFHTAGGNIALNADRESVFEESKYIIEQIYKGIKFKSICFFIVISNPVEIMCSILNKVLNYTHANQILGTGTMLDSIRFDRYIAEATNTDIKKIETKIIGEHGEGLILLEQHSTIDNYFYSEIDIAIIDDCMIKTKSTAKEIKQIEGHTKYGVANCALFIMNSLLKTEKTKTICSVLSNFNNTNQNTFLSLPVIFSNNNIEIENLTLNEKQESMLTKLSEKFNNLIK